MKRKAAVLCAAAGLCAVLAVAGWLFRAQARRGALYAEAQKLEAAGDASGAHALYGRLDGYRDASRRREALEAKDPNLAFRGADRGDALSFGRWEQDGDASNGPESIEWIVLDKVDGRLLLISSDALAGKAYNEAAFEPTTWETCALRGWLNGAFLDAAFTDLERAMIPAVQNRNADHSTAGTPGGNSTEDRIFLLSESDAAIYLSRAEDRFDLGRTYASREAQLGGLLTDEDGFCAWWLRSPGMYPYVTQYVDAQGTPASNGASADIDYLCGVRPALWVRPGEEGQA